MSARMSRFERALMIAGAVLFLQGVVLLVVGVGAIS